MQMVLNFFKRCSTSLIITEIQIKTTLRYNFSSIILTKKKLTTYSGGKVQGNRLMEMQNGTHYRGKFVTSSTTVYEFAF